MRAQPRVRAQPRMPTTVVTPTEKTLTPTPKVHWKDPITTTQTDPVSLPPPTLDPNQITTPPTHSRTLPAPTTLEFSFLRNNSEATPTNSHGQPLRRGTCKRNPNPRLTETYICNAVINEETGKLEEYRHLIKGKDAKQWLRGNAKEIARLSRGRKDAR